MEICSCNNSFKYSKTPSFVLKASLLIALLLYYPNLPQFAQFFFFNCNALRKLAHISIQKEHRSKDFNYKNFTIQLVLAAGVYAKGNVGTPDNKKKGTIKNATTFPHLYLLLSSFSSDREGSGLDPLINHPSAKKDTPARIAVPHAWEYQRLYCLMAKRHCSRSVAGSGFAASGGFGNP
jgi:hypothetical protein